MERRQIDTLLGEIRTIREQALRELNSLTEAEFELSTADRPWRWDTVRLVLLQLGNHMREHASHIDGTRDALDRRPTQPQRMLAQAEIAWGVLLAATAGLSDEDLDAEPAGGGWTLRRILEHVRNSEKDYMEAIRLARTEDGFARF